MIDVVFAFDVEDVVNEASDDAVLHLCRLFSEEGVGASLFVAAEKARMLRLRGRRDVIDAMGQHEICYHGNYWGDFPVPALEYGQDLCWDDAVAYALRVDAPGLNDVADILGQFPTAWCVHQAQWCPPMAYALKLAGVRCCAGGPRGWIMDWLSWGRSRCTLSSQAGWQQRVDPTHRGEQKPVMDVDAHFAAFVADFEGKASEHSFLTIVGHPTCFVTSDWGGLYDMAALFRDGRPVPYPRPSGVSGSVPRPSGDQEAAYELVRRQIRWLRERSDVDLVSYSSLCDREDEPGTRWVRLGELIALAESMAGELDHVSAYGSTFSCADVVGMLSFACEYCWREGVWPEMIPVQRLLGPVEEPLVSQERLTLSRENIFAGSRAMVATMMDLRRIPGVLRASMVDVGPGTWLRVLAAFVRESVQGREMPSEVCVSPGAELPACADSPVIAFRRFASSNHRPGLSMAHLWEHLRWQSWSYRPACRR